MVDCWTFTVYFKICLQATEPSEVVKRRKILEAYFLFSEV